MLQEGPEPAAIADFVAYISRSDLRTTYGVRLDAFDTASSSLQESLAGLSSAPFYKESSKVHLLCIRGTELSVFTTKEFNNEKDSSFPGYDPMGFPVAA